VSMREPGDYNLYNNIGTAPFYLTLIDSLDQSKVIKEQIKRMRNSPEPFAMYYFVQIAVLLPTYIALPLVDWYASKVTLTLTNIPGPRTPLTIGHSVAKSMIAFVPGVGNLPGGFSIMTCCDTLKMGLNSDVVCIPEPSKFIELFEQQFDALIGTA